MMKPKNYNNTSAGGYTPVNVGGHYCVIKQVKEVKSKTGKDMIVVCLDFASNDVQPNYFSKQFADDVRPEKKWPFAGTKYVMVQAYNSDDCSKDFKGFCEAAEKSNNFDINWNADFGAQFKGKAIGAVYGNVESEYNGKTSMRPELRWFCPVDRVSGAKVPEPKLLKKYSSASFGNNGTSNANTEDVPF